MSAPELTYATRSDTNGAFKGTQDHLPFGEEGGTTGVSEKHRFTNYERDAESNTDYAMNRQYETANGRFKQADPVAGSVMNPQSLNSYSYALNDPVNLYDPFGLYEGCVHQAMTEYLAKLSGRFSDSVARQLGQAAGKQAGGADSFLYQAFPNPINIILGFLGVGPSADIHFASEERLAQEKGNFAGYIASRDFKRAGFVLHSIEDVHGAHLGFHLPFGHAGSGHDPDQLIGGDTFTNVSNEVYQFLTGNRNAKLTPEQYKGLLNAIYATCAKQGDAKKLTRPRTVGAGGGRGFGGGGFGGSPFGNWDIFDLLGLSEGTVTSTYRLEPPDED